MPGAALHGITVSASGWTEVDNVVTEWRQQRKVNTILAHSRTTDSRICVSSVARYTALYVPTGLVIKSPLCLRRSVRNRVPRPAEAEPVSDQKNTRRILRSVPDAALRRCSVFPARWRLTS